MLVLLLTSLTLSLFFYPLDVFFLSFHFQLSFPAISQQFLSSVHSSSRRGGPATGRAVVFGGGHVCSQRLLEVQGAKTMQIDIRFIRPVKGLYKYSECHMFVC